MKFYIIFSLLGLLACSVVASDNCTLIDKCDDCVSESCHWIQCLHFAPSCQRPDEAEGCIEVSCDKNDTTTTSTSTTTSTTAPSTTTTTEATTITTDVPTTEPPTTEPPTEPPTTTTSTTTSTQSTTTAPTTPTTEAPTTQPPTEPPTTPAAPTTAAPPSPPEHRHFDAASFFGGMVLAVALLAVAYAGFRFYRSRNERNYHTLESSE